MRITLDIHRDKKSGEKMCDKYVIGYWLTEQKHRKINWNDFHKLCESEGFLLKRIDLNSSIESQGPIHVFIHKLVATLVHAVEGDQNAVQIISRLQGYFEQHPEVIVIDPFSRLSNLCNRYSFYELVREGIQHDDIFTPTTVEIQDNNVVENLSLIKRHGIKFPIVCKSLYAHGSQDSHKMMIVFNESGLSDCQPPCVAQTFINHNAIVYKIFVVNDKFHVVERPSLKNFYKEDCATLNTIFFNSHDVTRSGSKSILSVLSETNIPETLKPKYEVLELIVEKIREIFGLVLFGVDIVVENHTGKYAILDVNVFPGFDGYPNFFEHLIQCIKKLLVERKGSRHGSKNCALRKCLSDDLDSGFESDQKKKSSTKQDD